MKAKVYVTLKNGVLDPQGKAVEQSLGNLGYKNVKEVRQGKFIEIELNETDKEKAKQEIEKMCKDILANTVVENYKYEFSS